MGYGALADLLVMLHFLWILFMVFGVVFVLMGSRIAFFHLGGLLLSLFLNLMGWYCPLTYLENAFYLRAGRAAYEVSFMSRYLAPLVYPDLPENLIRAGEITFVCINLMIYAVWCWRHLGRMR